MLRSGFGAVLVLTACASPQAAAQGASEPVAAPTVAPTVAPPTNAGAPRSDAVTPSALAAATTQAEVEQACTGALDARLQQELTQRAADSRNCYEQLLGRNPKARGRMLISVRIRSAGEFERVVPTVDELGDPDHTACVLSQFKLALNATFAGNCVDVNIPLRFELKPEQSNSAAALGAGGPAAAGP